MGRRPKYEPGGHAKQRRGNEARLANALTDINVPMVTMSNWRDHAACYSDDTYTQQLNCEIAHGDCGIKAQDTFIRDMCGHCPVRLQCLQDGMTEIWGVWGGLLPVERRQLRQHASAVMNS